VTRSAAGPSLPDAIVAALRGEAAAWPGEHSIDTVFDACVSHDVVGLLHHRLQSASAGADWPPAFHDRVTAHARTEAAVDLARRSELIGVLDALASAGVQPILFKGAALAYDIYASPIARPRNDTDLLVPRAHVDAVRAALAGVGYAPTPYLEGELVFRQFELQKIDAFGVSHALDVHWNVSTQTLFANAFSYEELLADAIGVPALGPQARTVSRVHALLIACIHPVMHHRNEVRLIWTSDIHLLASRLSAEMWRAVTRLAIAKQMATIVAHGLALAQAQWHTPVPEGVLAQLATASDEPSARYLEAGRGWRHELVDNVAYLPTWRSRLRLIREILFPTPTYIARTYRVEGVLATVLLPALYVRRLVVGATQLLIGRKR
jgi:hypothetical protein